MKCLLCIVENNNDEVLKDYYTNFHSVEKDNNFFKELFTPDFDNKYSKRCMECGDLSFDTCREKKGLLFSTALETIVRVTSIFKKRQCNNNLLDKLFYPQK